MAANNPRGVGLMPSMLDRLIEPGATGGGVAGFSIEQMARAVRRDLEDLLNTRSEVQDASDQYPEVNKSIVGYGLPDWSSFAGSKPKQLAAVGVQLASIIERHEPRLRKVKVSVLPGKPGEHAIHYQIDAQLAVDPAPEVSFVTVLDLGTGHANVDNAEDAR